MPVLTIHGTWDRNAPYAAGREWALTLPNARLITVEGAAHQVTADAPEIVVSGDRPLRERTVARAGGEGHVARARPASVIARAAAFPRSASSTICACCSMP